MEKKKSDVNVPFVIVSTAVMFIILAVILIFVALAKDADNKFSSYLDYTRDFFNENYPDNHYFKLKDKVLYVNIWQPGTALYMVTHKGSAEQEIRGKMDSLAKSLYSRLENMGIEDYYKVVLILRNDENTENVLMYWVDGEYQDPNKQDGFIFY